MRAWRRPRNRPGAGKRKHPRNTWLGRLFRGLRPDRNPLRRGSDRAGAALLGVLLAAFLAGAPFAAHAAGSWTYATSTRAAQTQRDASRKVQATLLQAAAPWNGEQYGSEVSARWKAPDGQLRTGQVFVPNGAAAGSTLTIWVSPAGLLSNVPLRPSQITGRAELSAGLAVAALAVLLIVVGAVGRRTLNRRRVAGWEAEWLVTGPRWSAGGKTPASGD